MYISVPNLQKHAAIDPISNHQIFIFKLCCTQVIRYNPSDTEGFAEGTEGISSDVPVAGDHGQ